MRASLKFCAFLWIIAVFSFSGKVYAQKPHLKQAEAEFSRRRYDQAIGHYKRHLRDHPTDWDVWNFLAASYYHSGQPQKALRYLRRVNLHSRLKAYNLFYQGLCYEVLEDTEKAVGVFSAAARMGDDYASHATYELAVIYYKKKDRNRSMYWINQYLVRFPRGPFRNKLITMRDSLNRNQFLPEVEGSARPDMEKALFKFHRFSLLDKPHYWFFQVGYEYQQGLISNPARDAVRNLPTVKKEAFANHQLLTDTGFGLGPIKSADSVSYIGYHYYQYWLADSDRIATYLEDPTDLEYVPFRPDLMERHHTFLGSIEKKTNQYFGFGLFASYDVGRVGTSLFPVPGEQGIRKVLNVAKTSLLKPWFGLTYLDHYETRFYLFLRKELNEEQPEFSNKTYNFLHDSAEKVFSFGIEQKATYPAQKLHFEMDLYRYHFIYNDYWLDFTRQGLILKGTWDYSRALEFNGTFGLYTDDYELEQIRTYSCNPSSTDIPTSDEVKICKRVDNGFLYQLGVNWHISEFKAFSVFYNHVQNNSPQLKVYEKSTDTFNIMFTFAFPEVRRVVPFIGRYEDNNLADKVY